MVSRALLTILSNNFDRAKNWTLSRTESFYQHGLMELLHKADNIEISYDPETCILFCNWIGLQDEDGLKMSGQIILDQLKLKNCKKVLNDNTQVIGPWYHSVDWTSSTWFPEMIDAGLKHFAWVCSKDIFSQLSAKRAIPEGKVVKVFQDYAEALEWLVKI